jgi:hypothetical protein
MNTGGRVTGTKTKIKLTHINHPHESMMYSAFASHPQPYHVYGIRRKPTQSGFTNK